MNKGYRISEKIWKRYVYIASKIKYYLFKSPNLHSMNVSQPNSHYIQILYPTKSNRGLYAACTAKSSAMIVCFL